MVKGLTNQIHSKGASSNLICTLVYNIGSVDKFKMFQKVFLKIPFIQRLLRANPKCIFKSS